MRKLTGFLLAAAIAAIIHRLSRPPRRGAARRAASRLRLLDLNTASTAQLLALGPLDELLVERIIENRPYHDKLDLLSRVVVPGSIYQAIRGRITAEAA